MRDIKPQLNQNYFVHTTTEQEIAIFLQLDFDKCSRKRPTWSRWMLWCLSVWSPDSHDGRVLHAHMTVIKIVILLSLYYIRQGGYVIVVVWLLATLRKNFQTDLHEIFREDWQWASEQIIKFWWQSSPDRNAGKTCLGGGMHCPSASSMTLVWWLHILCSSRRSL